MSKGARPGTPWPNVEELIDNGGNITLGYLSPIACAATAADEDIMYAALQRRDGESLMDLLDRLDAALETAFTQDIYTDEINT